MSDADDVEGTTPPESPGDRRAPPQDRPSPPARPTRRATTGGDHSSHRLKFFVVVLALLASATAFLVVMRGQSSAAPSPAPPAAVDVQSYEKAEKDFDDLCPYEISVPALFETDVLGLKNAIYNGRIDHIQSRVFVYGLTVDGGASSLSSAAAAAASALTNGQQHQHVQMHNTNKNRVIYAPVDKEAWDCASTYEAVSPAVKKKKSYRFEIADADNQYVVLCIRNDPSVCPGELNQHPNLDTESMRNQLLRLGITTLHRKKNPFSSAVNVANAPRKMLLSALLWHSHLLSLHSSELRKFKKKEQLGESFRMIHRRHKRGKDKAVPSTDDIPLVVSYVDHHKEISDTVLDLGICEKKIRVPLRDLRLPKYTAVTSDDLNGPCRHGLDPLCDLGYAQYMWNNAKRPYALVEYRSKRQMWIKGHVNEGMSTGKVTCAFRQYRNDDDEVITIDKGHPEYCFPSSKVYPYRKKRAHPTDNGGEVGDGCPADGSSCSDDVSCPLGTSTSGSEESDSDVTDDDDGDKKPAAKPTNPSEDEGHKMRHKSWDGSRSQTRVAKFHRKKKKELRNSLSLVAPTIADRFSFDGTYPPIFDQPPSSYWFVTYDRPRTKSRIDSPKGEWSAINKSILPDCSGHESTHGTNDVLCMQYWHKVVEPGNEKELATFVKLLQALAKLKELQVTWFDLYYELALGTRARAFAAGMATWNSRTSNTIYMDTVLLHLLEFENLTQEDLADAMTIPGASASFQCFQQYLRMAENTLCAFDLLHTKRICRIPACFYGNQIMAHLAIKAKDAKSEIDGDPNAASFSAQLEVTNGTSESKRVLNQIFPTIGDKLKKKEPVYTAPVTLVGRVYDGTWVTVHEWPRLFWKMEGQGVTAKRTAYRVDEETGLPTEKEFLLYHQFENAVWKFNEEHFVCVRGLQKGGGTAWKDRESAKFYIALLRNEAEGGMTLLCHGHSFRYYFGQGKEGDLGLEEANDWCPYSPMLT